ncbi:hypothetical protein F4804DRAFT_299944 [Jackrogersella minutella]|nr:hypothetical protein F4804DRAFT_299944 [Jackrogersella minutella]
MSHPQQTMPPRQFTPQQSSPNQSYQLPNKRAKLSPGSGMPLTMPVPALTMPATVPTPLASPRPTTPNPPSAPYSTAKLAPFPANSSLPSMPSSIPSIPSMPPMPPMPSGSPVITNMGPPAINPQASFASNDATKQTSKSAGKATANYDVDDMLVGTGIDLEEEAAYLNSIGPRSFNTRENMSGLPNQSSQSADAPTPEDLAVEMADKAWNESAARLARAKSIEMSHYLLEPGLLHKRLHDAADKFGLSLNMELKPDAGRYSGRHQNHAVADPPKPELKPCVHKSIEGMHQVYSSVIPTDAYLVDQLALLSLSTSQHLSDLLRDANRIATTRQTSAHGVVPQEWINAALQPAANELQGGNTRTGAESAVSPRTNPLKRSADELSNGLPTPVSEVYPVNQIEEALATIAKEARALEEIRLKKRQKRLDKQNADKDKEAGDGLSRAGSIAPGTPGSIAPEPEKLSKKDTKAQKEAKKATKSSEANSTMVNQTVGLFIGSKKKKYAWMVDGPSGSGASTPRLSTATPTAKQQPRQLTRAGVAQLGQIREDVSHGKNIQLRDWIVVLESRGYDAQALQRAYTILDRSWKAGVGNTS